MVYLSFCVKCGRKLPDDARFCPNCGAPVAPKVAAPIKPKAVAEKPSMHVRLKHYMDDEGGFSFDYPNLAGWEIEKPRADLVMLSNDQLKASIIFSVTQSPSSSGEEWGWDLSDPSLFDSLVSITFGKYKKLRPSARLLSSRPITNPNNGVKGVELVLTDKPLLWVSERPLKINSITFSKGDKRYDVTATAPEENFDRADREFFAPVLKSFNF